MSGPRRYKPSGSWRVLAVVASGIFIVIGIAGLRYYRGDSARVATAPRLETSAALADAIQDLQATQQQVIDELQITRDRVVAQDIEIKKLTSDLQGITQKMDTLRNSFASEPLPDGVKR
jgi:uncharacterized coiled-coil protein SlyX